MPSVFFNLIILVNINETTLMVVEILRCIKPLPDNSDKKRIFNNVIEFIMSGFTTEFLFLMITNGLTMIFVLSESVLGVIMIITGVIITRYISSTIQVKK